MLDSPTGTMAGRTQRNPGAALGPGCWQRNGTGMAEITVHSTPSEFFSQANKHMGCPGTWHGHWHAHAVPALTLSDL